MSSHTKKSVRKNKFLSFREGEYLIEMKRNKWLYLLVLPAFLGTLLIFLSATRYGPAISTDSVAYIYAAEHLIKGDGFIYFGYSTPFIQWPPLYPFIIGLFIALGLDAISAALYLNALVFGLIVFFSGYWIHKNVSRFIYTIIGTFMILLSMPLYRISKFVWSESLFILLIILFFISMEQYIRTDRKTYFLLAALFTALACITRYTGVALIITGLASIFCKKKKFLKKLFEMFLFGAASSMPLLLWVIRNYLVSKTLMGARTESHYSLVENIRFTLTTVVSWLIPGELLVRIENYTGIRINRIFLLALLILIMFIICTGFVYAIKRSIKKYSKVVHIDVLSMICPLAFIIIYIINLIISASSVAFDIIDNRLLSPIFVPIVFLFILSVEKITVEQGSRLKKQIYTWGLIGGMIIWISLSTFSVFYDIKNSIKHGAGIFATDKWHNSPTINYMRQSPLNYLVFSNCPDAVYYLTKVPSRYTPRKNSLPEYGIGNFDKALKDNESVYIVWFNKNTSDSVYNVKELSQKYNLVRIQEFDDSVIYKVSKCRNFY